MGGECRVGEDGRRHAVVLNEPLRLLGRAVAENDQFAASCVDTGDVVTQLRDLLLAEDSAEVADHREEDGLALPERAQADLRTSGVENLNIAELLDGRSFHASIVAGLPRAPIGGGTVNAIW